MDAATLHLLIPQAMLQYQNMYHVIPTNPFQDIKYIHVSCPDGTMSKSALVERLNNSDNVIARKVENRWILLYPIDALQVKILVNWYSDTHGSFRLKHGSSKFYFRLDTDIMSIW